MTIGPLQANATVTAVKTASAATGGRDDWDTQEGVEPAGAEAAKWSGTELAYYREAIDKVDGNVLVRRTLYLQTAAARTMGIDTDDVITFTGPDGVERKATAVLVAYADPTRAGELGGLVSDSRIATTRLELQPA